MRNMLRKGIRLDNKGRKEMTGKQRKKRTRVRIIIGFMIVLSIVVGHFAGRVVYEYNHSLSLLNRESGIDLSDVDVDQSKLASENKIINILLVGADKRKAWKEAGRSDSVMIATLDLKHKQLKLTSLMRDMYVQIPGHGENRFNAAYSYGGITLLYQTIAENLGIKLDGYVVVDFAAFKQVINKIGGVEIELTDAEYQYLVKAYAKKNDSAKHVKPGLNLMNGEQALAYTRIRQDAKADFGRTQRQRNVLQSIFTKAKGMSIGELKDLANKLLPSIVTDLSNGEITSYLLSVIMMGTTEFEQLRIPVDNSFQNQKIRGMAVLVLDLQKNRDALQNFIFQEVNDSESTNNEE